MHQCTENHIFAIKSSRNTKEKFRVGTKIGSVRLVETNNFLRVSLIHGFNAVCKM